MHKETYEETTFCIHERHLYNQGLMWCNINGPMDKGCENCPFRIQGTQTVTLSTATTYIPK